VAWGCRSLHNNGFTGTLPTELGTLTALTHLCVHRPHPPCLDACAITGLWLSVAWGAGIYTTTIIRGHCLQSWATWLRWAPCACAVLSHRAWTCALSPGCGLSVAAWGCRYLFDNDLTLPTELGTMDTLGDLCVRCPHPPCLDACAITGLWLRVAWGCRRLYNNGFMGTLPTELGTMDAYKSSNGFSGYLCVHHPHTPRPDVCDITGLWTERGGVRVQVAKLQRFHGAAAYRAGHHGHAVLPVRASPSPTRAWARHRVAQ
jgi:hypothetical protein